MFSRNNNNRNYNQQSQRNRFAGLEKFFKTNSALRNLILINTAVWLVISSINIFSWLMQTNDNVTSISIITQYLALPSDINSLLMRPWTLITYMFVHERFIHLFFNMLMLYIGGNLFTQYLGSKKLIFTYFLGGITGALLYIISYNTFPAFSTIVSGNIAYGASAAIMAIFIGIASYYPNYNIRLALIGNIKLKYIALIFIALDLLMINKSNPGGHITHLGGALFGFVWFALINNKKMFSGLRNKLKAVKYNRKLQSQTKKQEQKKKDIEKEEAKNKSTKSKKVNNILDKIKKSGYDSLTKEEKELLFKK